MGSTMAQLDNGMKTKPVRSDGFTRSSRKSLLRRSVWCAVFILPFVATTHNAMAVNAPIQADAYTSSGSPTQNFGSAKNLQASSLNALKRAYVRFDLATLPFGTVSVNVLHASLLLWVSSVTPNPVIGTPFQVVRLPDPGSFAPWNEATITYNNQPPIPFGVTPIQVAPKLNQYLVVDVTADVKWWIDHPTSNAGFVILAPSGDEVIFDSKENNGNVPLLDITLATTGGQGPPGAAATVTVGSTATGAPGTPASVSNTGTPSAAVLNFTVPQGVKGDPGAPGAPGAKGDAGAKGDKGDTGTQGPPGASGGLTLLASDGTTIGSTITVEPTGRRAFVYAHFNGIGMNLVVTSGPSRDSPLQLSAGLLSNWLYFSQADCQGQTYVSETGWNLGDQRLSGALCDVNNNCDTRSPLFVGVDQPPVPLTMLSMTTFADYASNPSSCDAGPFPGAFVPVQFMIDLSAIPRPLRLQ